MDPTKASHVRSRKSLGGAPILREEADNTDIPAHANVEFHPRLCFRASEPLII